MPTAGFVSVLELLFHILEFIQNGLRGSTFNWYVPIRFNSH